MLLAMRTLPLDVRHALRALLKCPASTAVVVLTLALGLGANAAIFAIIDALVIRPFHFTDADRITLISETNPDGSDDRQETTSPANFLDWRRQVDAIQQLSAFEWWDVNLVGRDEPERVQGFQVSSGFFAALGVRPAAGRSFSTDDEVVGRHRVVVVGDGLWRRRFGADPAAVGRRIQLDGNSYEIVGIAPPGFDFPMGAELWAPLAFDAKTAARRDARYLTVIGRLAPDRSIDDARSQMAVIGERLQQAHPEANRGRSTRVHTLAQGMLDQGLGPILSLWQASALFVLLIACANIANLLLARGAERQREIAVRVAIGASRSRIVRALLLESVILGLLATPAALAAAWAGLRLLVSYMPAKIARFVPGWHDIDLDGRLVAFTLLLAVGTAIVFGLLPALQSSKGRILDGLKDGARGASPGRHRLRRALVVAEMTLALPLLVASGMSAVGVNRFLNGRQGFDPDRLLSLQVVLAEGRHPDAAAWLRFTTAAVERLAAAGGVREAAAVNIMPAAPNNSARGIEIESRPNPDPQNPPDVDYRAATPRIFDTLGIPILQGRAFTDADREGAQHVAIVSQSMARRFWPGVDPIGRRVRIVRENEPWLTVVGVSGDFIQNWFNRRNSPTLYRPYAQAPAGRFALLARTDGDPVRFAADARAAVRAVDPEQPVFDVLSMRQVLKERTLGLQYVAAIMTVFGGFALVLAIVGVYSVMAYLVAQRTQEFGIRLALGATPREVVRLTVSHTVKVTLVGVAVGAAFAVALGRLIEAGLVGVASNDFRLIAGIAFVLVAAAAAAGYLPARRAAATDPIVALRTE
jgi:putative ABC transport system permease protein